MYTAATVYTSSKNHFLYTTYIYGLPYCATIELLPIGPISLTVPLPLSCCIRGAFLAVRAWWLSKWLAAPLKPLPISRSRHLRLAARRSGGSFEPRAAREYRADTPIDRSVRSVRCGVVVADGPRSVHENTRARNTLRDDDEWAKKKWTPKKKKQISEMRLNTHRGLHHIMPWSLPWTDEVKDLLNTYIALVCYVCVYTFIYTNHSLVRVWGPIERTFMYWSTCIWMYRECAS